MTERGYEVAEVATRSVTTTDSVDAWIKKYGPDTAEHKFKADDEAEIRRLKKDLKPVTGMPPVS